MMRRPAGLHPQSVRNTGGRARRPPVVDQAAYVNQIRAPIGGAAAQGIVANDGTAILALGPQGIGTRWYPSAVELSTSSGPADQSECVLYRDFVAASQVIGRTAQGGGDQLAFTHAMQPGNLVYAMWARANPGDLATLTMHGDQLALTT